MKECILFDHDGVLVDTEPWYFKAGERALEEIGVSLDKDQYLRDMTQGLGTWTQARAAGVDEQTISRQRELRDELYREYVTMYDWFGRGNDMMRRLRRIGSHDAVGALR